MHRKTADADLMWSIKEQVQNLSSSELTVADVLSTQ